MCVYLHAKFQVSSLILTYFRQGTGGYFYSPLLKASPPRLGLMLMPLVTYLSVMLLRHLLNFDFVLGNEIWSINRI